MARAIEVDCSAHQYVNKVVGGGVRGWWVWIELAFIWREPPPPYSSVIYSVAFGTFSGSPLPGGELEGDRAGCLRCVTCYNGNFCTFSFLFALQSVRQQREAKSPSPLCLSRWSKGGSAHKDQMLWPAKGSFYFEAVWLQWNSLWLVTLLLLLWILHKKPFKTGFCHIVQKKTTTSMIQANLFVVVSSHISNG